MTNDVQQVVERMFPVQDGPDIPWSVIAPFEKQCRKQHYQTLERLAERGGLSVSEVLSILEGEGDYDTYWTLPGRNAKDKTTNILRLTDLVAERRQVTAQPAPSGWQPELVRKRLHFVQMILLSLRQTLPDLKARLHRGDPDWVKNIDTAQGHVAEVMTLLDGPASEPSGWQQRIAAMIVEAIAALPQDYNASWQERAVPLVAGILWQNAVDAGQNAKDALSPEQEHSFLAPLSHVAEVGLSVDGVSATDSSEDAIPPAPPAEPVMVEYSCGCRYTGHNPSASCPQHSHGAAIPPAPEAACRCGYGIDAHCPVHDDPGDDALIDAAWAKHAAAKPDASPTQDPITDAAEEHGRCCERPTRKVSCANCGDSWPHDPIADAVHAELEPLADALIKEGHKYAKGLPLNRFDCPECGQGVKACEDGTCASCGGDVVIIADGKPSVAEKEID